MSKQLISQINSLQNELRHKNATLSALGQGQVNGNVIKDFYIYQENFLSLASNDSQTGSINIQADSDFVLQKMTYSVDIAGAAQTDSSRVIPLCSVQLTDTGSGRNLMDSACPIPSIFGTGQIPFILSQPKLFLARSTITLSVANYSNNTTYNLRLSLIGHKIFRGLTG